MAIAGVVDRGPVVVIVLWFLAAVVNIVARFGIWRGQARALPLPFAIVAATVPVIAGIGCQATIGGAFGMPAVFVV